MAEKRGKKLVKKETVFREIIANVEPSKPRNGTRSKRSKKGKK